MRVPLFGGLGRRRSDAGSFREWRSVLMQMKTESTMDITVMIQATALMGARSIYGYLELCTIMSQRIFGSI